MLRFCASPRRRVERHPPGPGRGGGGAIRLEALVELKSLNSSFGSSNFSIRAFRACPLVELRQTVPFRAIRGMSSDSRQQYLGQQYHPPPSYQVSVRSARSVLGAFHILCYSVPSYTILCYTMLEHYILYYNVS